MCKLKSKVPFSVVILLLIVVIIWVMIGFGIKSLLHNIPASQLEAYQSTMNNLLTLGSIVTAAVCAIWSIYSSTKDMKDATSQLTTNANNALGQAKDSDLQSFELARLTMALDMIDKMMNALKKEVSIGLQATQGDSSITLKIFLDKFILYINKLKVLYPSVDFTSINSVQKIANIDDNFQLNKKVPQNPDFVYTLFNYLSATVDELELELTQAIGSKIEGFERFNIDR